MNRRDASTSSEFGKGSRQSPLPRWKLRLPVSPPVT